LPGDNEFFYFAQRIFRWAQVEIFCQLHGDRAAAAAEAPSFPVLFQRCLEFVQVNALVAVERGVFANQHRLFQVFRDRSIKYPVLSARAANIFLLVLFFTQLH
jgi:hypothetical protein